MKKLLISLSGRLDSVTISTNIAGRGTDIVLEDGAEALGGLKVIGVGIGENVRIDNQLKGRSGRQGDKGSGIFFVSLDEEIINPLENDKIEAKIARLDLQTKKGLKQALDIITSSQKTHADIGYQARKNMAELDDFVHMLRLLLYKERDQILMNNTASTFITYLGKTFSALYSSKFMTKEFQKQRPHIQIETIQSFFDKILFEGQLAIEALTAPIEEYQNYITSKVSNIFLIKTTSNMDRINRISKEVILVSIDEVIAELLDDVEFMGMSYFLTPQKDKKDWLKSIEGLQKQLLESLEIRILQRAFMI